MREAACKQRVKYLAVRLQTTLLCDLHLGTSFRLSELPFLICITGIMLDGYALFLLTSIIISSWDAGPREA